LPGRLRIASEPYEILDEFPGAVMEGLKCRHPLIDRETLLILAPFVTLDAGTGCVHIAPGHGQEDYEIGMKYGLDNYAPWTTTGSLPVTSRTLPVVLFLKPTGRSIKNWRRRAPSSDRWTSSTPIPTAAVQAAHHLPFYGAVVHLHGEERPEEKGHGLYR